MAPEVLLSTKVSEYGFEVDVYSFGVLLYETLALQLPYSNLTPFKISELVIEGKFFHQMKRSSQLVF